MINVYYESWKGLESLKMMDKRVEVVYIAFADPRKKWEGWMNYDWKYTGLNFLDTGDAIQKTIAMLRTRGVHVILSVGGGSYPFPKDFKAKGMVDLAIDLGCNGIDIDWEPHGTDVVDTQSFADIIEDFRIWIDSYDREDFFLTAAVWSTGAMQPRENDRFRGCCIKGLEQHGDKLDWLNVMAYDCGPWAMINPIDCFWCYRQYFKKGLVMGFCVGKMGWNPKEYPDYATTKEEVTKALEYTANVDEHPENGLFIWAYNKDDYKNGVTRDYILEEGTRFFDGEELEKCCCPHCKKPLKIVAA